MKVFCWTTIAADLLPQRQAMAQWHRSWRDAGFDPFIVTPEMRPPPNLTKVLKASGQPESMFARWFAPISAAFTGWDQVLMVEPTILPVIRADQFPVVPTKSEHKFTRYDLQGRVIHARKSPAKAMHEALRHGEQGFREFRGQPFTDWDLMLLDFTDAPTVDATTDSYVAANHWFRNYSQTDILELRAKRLTL